MRLYVGLIFKTSLKSFICKKVNKTKISAKYAYKPKSLQQLSRFSINNFIRIASMRDSIYSVSELTELIKENLELTFPYFQLIGEVSNCKYHSSGHIYFTLKDEQAQIPAIVWRSLATKLSFEIEDGLELIVEGRLEVYPPSGRYQVICQNLAVKGEGLLQQQFAALMQKLAEETLFDESHKKPIPRLPNRIGIVTSKTGAVIEDIKTVLSRRFPTGRLALYPVKVQGAGASEEIATAIEYFNTLTSKKPDVLIVGRGGGSLEDMWAFNEERVARAIFNSHIPIISAVGHETDITIADMVADKRASTPSMAAEIAAPEANEIIASVEGSITFLEQTLQARLDGASRQVESILNSYSFNYPLKRIENMLTQLDSLTHSMDYEIEKKWTRAKNDFKAAVQKLELLNYNNVLKRGFAIVHKDGTLVKSSQELSGGDRLKLGFYDGQKGATVD